jgi:hypothetical protein
MKRLLFQAGGALVLGLFVVIGVSTSTLAKERQTVNDGWNACVKWCDDHNKTDNSRSTCYKNCEKYWKCNGSDSTPELCRSAGAAAIAPPTSVLPPPTTNPKAPVAGRTLQAK